MVRDLNLIVHSGGFHATRSEVEAVPTPPSDRTYTAVPYATYLRMIETAVRDHGYTIDGERYALSKRAENFFAIWSLKNGVNQPDWGMLLGMRTGHDRKTGLSLAAGSHVFVCDNWAFSGEVVIHAVHRGDVESRLVPKVTSALVQTKGYHLQFANRVEKWKSEEISDERARALVLYAAEVGAFPVTKALPVINEYLEPRHEEFKPRTMWSLFNAFTEVQKARGPESLFKDTPKLYQLLSMN